MTIPESINTLHFTRRCIAAHFLGKESALVADFALVGIDITEDDVRTNAEYGEAAFYVFDADKPNCYLCGKDRVHGTLCSCFGEVSPRRHFNVNDPRVLAKLAPETVVETYCCKQCAAIDHVDAAAALTSHERNGHYKARLYCGACFNEKKQARAKKPRAQKQKPQPRPSLRGDLDMLAMASASVQSAGDA